MHNSERYIEPLLALCYQAGQSICEHYRAPLAGKSEAKLDGSPLTQADIDSHHILIEGLNKLQPQLPVLSEESEDEVVADRLGWPRFWLIDPLDGTKEFLGRTGEFTINIALVEGHRPVLGVIYVPLRKIAYVGIPGALATRCCRAEDGSWESSLLRTRPLAQGQPLVVLASRRNHNARLTRCLEEVVRLRGPTERNNSGSALKFCQLAEGVGDFYPRFSRCCEWDTAAGQAILEAAGGALWGLDGKPLLYNHRESLYSPDFLAVGDPDNPLWQQLLRYVSKSSDKAG